MKARLIVALDTAELKVAKQLVEKLVPLVQIFKVGSQLFTACGPQIIPLIQQRGAQVFLDLKFHDIPHTVGRAVEAACRYSPLMLTVHTLGGSPMLEAAVQARNNVHPGTKILGVTILTSLDKAQLEEIGLGSSVSEEVLCLAQMARAAGLDGVVASPREIEILRKNLGRNFLLVSPGIRADSSLPDDQKRTLTAKEAASAGADYLVVGRPITQAAEPVGVAQKIVQEIG